MPRDGRRANQEQEGLEENRESRKKWTLVQSSHLNDSHRRGSHPGFLHLWTFSEFVLSPHSSICFETGTS